MVIKLLTLAMVILLVSCGAPTENKGSDNSGSQGGGGEVKKASAELVELRKKLEDDYSVLIILNISSEAFQMYIESLKGKVAIKSTQSFTSSDVNCKSFNFTKVGSGTNADVIEANYKSKIESESSQCQEKDFKNVDEVGDKNYIIIGKIR